MIARFIVDKTAKLPEDRHYLEMDITDGEMENIKDGVYPDQKVFIHKVDENGKKVEGTEMMITVSVGLLI